MVEVNGEARKTEIEDSKRKVKKVAIKTEFDFEPINEWWKITEESDIKWRYLEHKGPIFTAFYEPHGIPLVYEGKDFPLDEEAEEIAGFWVSIQNSDYAGKQQFQENFWNIFKAKIGEEKQLEKCDFSKISDYIQKIKTAKKELSKEEKKKISIQNEKNERPYKFCLFEEIQERIGNYKIEPPGLFRGRGEHPKMGCLKSRIYPEDVVYNCSTDAPVAKLPHFLNGFSWGDVIHDNSVSWLVGYKDSVINSQKYVQLANTSYIKSKTDSLKYEKARKLKQYIDNVRKDYNSKMASTSYIEQQLGTATYLIDFLALRVGNEKDTSELADTVGCCSLRIEHIHFLDDLHINLDFLGKDSIRYLNTVKIQQNAFQNLQTFCKDKQETDLIFDEVTPFTVNKYLKDLMPSLSAKVFRTFNASVTLTQELSKINNTDLSNAEDVLRFYNDANRQVAILCNHQRSVSRLHDTSMLKLKRQLLFIEENIRELQEYKKNPKTKFISTIVLEENEKERKSLISANMTSEQIQIKLTRLDKQRSNLLLKMQMKEDNKLVSNSTSKQHYMDPRISVAFGKKYDIPIEKIFTTGLQNKFVWSMFSESTYEF